MIWVNGAVVQDKDVHPWGLIRVLRRERGIVGALIKAGVKGRAEAVELLTHPNISTAQSEKDMLDGVFDASDRLEGGNVIIWWNDIERDSKYAKWSPSVYSVSLLLPAV
jgi:UDP-glucose:glycoprotein glucosyltransferase